MIVEYEVWYRGTEVAFEPRRQSKVRVWVDMSGNVNRADGPLPFDLTGPATTGLRSALDAAADVVAKRAEVGGVIQVERPDFLRAENFAYASVDFVHAELVYAVKNSGLTPVFRFTGNARNRDGKLLQVEVIARAVP